MSSGRSWCPDFRHLIEIPIADAIDGALDSAPELERARPAHAVCAIPAPRALVAHRPYSVERLGDDLIHVVVPIRRQPAAEMHVRRVLSASA